MTTDTSKAPERIWAIPERNCTVYMSGNSPITAQDGPFTHHRHGTANEYVRRDLFDAMQARAEKVEAAIGLNVALIQEELRVRIRAETARDGLRHVVEGLEAERDAIRAENERLREALERVADAVTTRSLRGRDHTPSMREEQDAVGSARAALERKEGA